MEFKLEATLDKPIEAVWEVLGNQFTDAWKWAGGLYHSEGVGSPQFAEATCDNRVCETNIGRIIEKVGDRTRVRMHLVIKTKGIMGLIMGPMMKKKMGKLVPGILQDFTHYLETGQPSPRKAAELAKNATQSKAA